MYFRDMAELDVLRPEQEFETARHIEELELDLWRHLLSLPAASLWVADLIEKAVTHPVAELKNYRALAEKAKPRIAISARSKLDKVVTEVAAKLKELDIDRLFVEAVMNEVQRVAKAAEWRASSRPAAAVCEHQVVRGVCANRWRQDGQDQAGQERVREGEPAPGGLHRAPLQPRPPAAA